MSRGLLTVLSLIVLTGAETLVAAPPTIESVAPGVGQRGTEFTLKLTGSRLTDPKELLFYTPGVVCTKLTAESENAVTATLRAATDSPLGECPFRLLTSGGVSELRVLRITPFPVVAEVESNDSRPHEVSLNVSVTGATESGGVDRFAVKLKKGQRLSAEVEGIRLGGELTDTALAVIGPDGKTLATVDDTPLFRQDPFLSLRAPSDGVYTVEVRDTNYGGGDNNRYVLHVGSFSRPAAVYPAGGEVGTEVNVKLFDDGGETTQKLKLPSASIPFAFHPTDGDGPPAPTSNPFRVSPFPNVLEVEPNDDPAKAGTAPAWPVALNGVVEKPGDADHFRFRAAKGDEIDVQAFAYRLGSPLDPVVAVLHPNGELLAWNDDDETHDSRVRVKIPADGEYLVRVTDKRKQGGPRFIYRVELTKPQAGLSVFLAPTTRKTQDRQVLIIPRGNRAFAYLAVRRDGFDGPVTVSASDLPAGVKLNVPPIPVGEYLMPVVFEAAADAPIGGRLVSLTGRGGDTKATVTGGFTQAITLVSGPGDSVLHAVEVSKLAVAVVEESPFSVSVTAPTVPVPVDGTLDVTVQVTRAKDFVEPLDVAFITLPPGVEAPTKVTVPADKAEVKVTLVGHPSAELGECGRSAGSGEAAAGRTGSPSAPHRGRNGSGVIVCRPGSTVKRAGRSGRPAVRSPPTSPWWGRRGNRSGRVRRSER